MNIPVDAENMDPVQGRDQRHEYSHFKEPYVHPCYGLTTPSVDSSSQEKEGLL